MAGGKNIMSRDSRVEPLQFRNPESRLSNCTGRNLYEKLEVIRIQLFKNCDRAGRTYKVNAASRRIKLDVVCAAHAVEHLHHFPGICIHDNQLSWFMLVPASNIAGMGFGPAADKQAMMGCVQTCGVGHRAAGDWPLGDDSAFFEIYDRNVAVTVDNISHRDVQSFSGRLDCDAGRITAGELNAAHELGRSCVDY